MSVKQRIYRASWVSAKDHGEHRIYTYHTQMGEIEAKKTTVPHLYCVDVEELKVDVSLSGMIQVLKDWGSHPDNG